MEPSLHEEQQMRFLNLEIVEDWYEIPVQPSNTRFAHQQRGSAAAVKLVSICYFS